MANLESRSGTHDGCQVYLDHAANTPMLPEAFDAMVAELAHIGNPSSLHNAGRRARRVIEESREQIAQTYGARPSEVIFTSGGTEADNLAIKGLFWSRRGPGSWRARPTRKPGLGRSARASPAIRILRHRDRAPCRA